MDTYKVVANMATFPERIDSFKKTINSILPQVDQLNIYLNEYRKVPDFLLKEKINAVLAKDAMGDLMDTGKFYFLDKTPEDAYYFTIDDDIIYPKNYVKAMTEKLAAYKNEVAVGVHGVIFHLKFKSFRRTRTSFYFGHDLKNDLYTSILGTGTVAFYKKGRFKSLSLDSFKTTGAADLWFAAYCKENRIPMVCISRKKAWLKEINVTSKKNLYSLWDESSKNEKKQNEIIKKHKLWEINPSQVDSYRSYLENGVLSGAYNTENTKYMEKISILERNLGLLVNSKTIRLRDLLFRSVKNPLKIITFPWNSLNILLKDDDTEFKNNFPNETTEKSYCSVCKKYSIFLDSGDPIRSKISCLNCGSLERHRFLYYIYQLLFLNDKRVIDLLHMAPEKCLYDELVNDKSINYISADLNPAGYTFAKCLKEDFTNLSFKDKTFDVILTNHVLEHIVDEQKYLSEMKRCLRDDGCIVLSIPYNVKLAETFEDSDVKTPDERKKVFGQDDHVRIYGLDVYERLQGAGFSVNQVYPEMFPEEFIEKNRLEKGKSKKGMSGGYFILKKKL